MVSSRRAHNDEKLLSLFFVWRALFLSIALRSHDRVRDRSDDHRGLVDGESTARWRRLWRTTTRRRRRLGTATRTTARSLSTAGDRSAISHTTQLRTAGATSSRG